MAGELVHVWHEDGLLASSCCAADTLAELDLLAGGLAVEGAQEEVLVLRGRVCGGNGHTGDAVDARQWRGGDGRGKGGEFIIADVEAGPVDGGGGGWEGSICVPEERGDVGKVANLFVVSAWLVYGILG